MSLSLPLLPQVVITSFMITGAALQKKERECRSDLQLVFCVTSKCPPSLHQKGTWERDSHHLDELGSHQRY